jgi:hypothetical protein
MMPELELWQWALAAGCGLFIGAAKTGIPGLGSVSGPFMVFAVGDARLAAAWALPPLILADIFAVMYWRRHANMKRVLSLSPWVLVGLVIGAVALSMSERSLRPIIGVIVIVMLVIYLIRRYRPAWITQTNHPAPFGAAAGVTTMIANAAGPVMNIYLLSMKLGKEEFLGTAAWFFFLLNLIKSPVYFGYGLYSRETVGFTIAMAPTVVLGALAGKWLADRVSRQVFEWMVIVLTAITIPLLFR